LGGGSLMIAVMAIYFPPAIVIPVHGCIQLASNGGRAAVQRAHIQWRFAFWFALGSAFGAAVGGQIAILLPENLFKAAIGLFILYLVWIPRRTAPTDGAPATVLAGLFTSAISMVVGISGPLVAAFLRGLKDRRQIVGTHAFLMSVQNLFKVLAFVLLGFAFTQYLPFIIAMAIAGFLGTLIGSQLLDRLPERLFRLGFRIVLTGVALELLRRASVALLAN
ncbi:MAG: sulfite exporter TauE/SafE family protein, partial [Alphaproteobacteria bacterium]|nr:sulfite exporter TauE/SafE family protein [Alphaproteobacteria bacterium]